LDSVDDFIIGELRMNRIAIEQLNRDNVLQHNEILDKLDRKVGRGEMGFWLGIFSVALSILVFVA
jgi:hypothetical protein